MIPSPHRLAKSQPADRGQDESPSAVDRDLLLPFALLWIVSLVRVVGAVVAHEVFGAEATLALMVVALLPWAARHRSS